MTVRRARVTAAYATVKINDPASGKPTVLGFYEGAVLPETADPENVASLVARGYAEYLDSSDTKALDKQETAEDKAAAEAAKVRADEAEAAAKKAEADRLAAEKAAAKTAKVETK